MNKHEIKRTTRNKQHRQNHSDYYENNQNLSGKLFKDSNSMTRQSEFYFSEN